MTQYKDAAIAAANLALASVLQANTALNDAILALQEALNDIQNIVEPTPTPTASTTPTPTASETLTPTPTPSASASASASPTPTPSTSHSATPPASNTPTPTASSTPSATPKPSPSPVATGRVLPVRKRGVTIIDAVKTYAIDTTGKTDVTAKFQSAVNALPADGGTVYVSAGSYLINAEVSINLRSNMLFDMHPDAKFYVKTNSSPKYVVLKVQSQHDVEIRGGQLFGDRATHNYVKIYLADGVTLSSLSTHEWGHGIKLIGSTGVTVNGTHASNLTGDGCSVGAYNATESQDIILINVVADNNRRQGLSITNVFGIKVYDSAFINTNGTSPQCGIDIEPDNNTGAATCDNVWIEGCTFSGNAVYGLNVFLRITNVTVIDNDFIDNVSCGAVTVQVDGIKFLNNRFTSNGSTGLFIKKDTTGYEVTGNEFKLNYEKQGPTLRATPLVKAGIVTGTARDLLVSAGSVGVVNVNQYD